jgi:hypothetical protein
LNDYDAGDDEATIAIKAKLVDLRHEHYDLDTAVNALLASPSPDMIQIARMKKRKLALRDQIIAMEDQLTPDIIA